MDTWPGILTRLASIGVVLLGTVTGHGSMAAPSWTAVPVAADPDDHAGLLTLPDDSRFSDSYRCRGAECGIIPVGCVLRTYPRKPEQWKDDDLEYFLVLMSEDGLRFLAIEADVRRAYEAIGDATLKASSIVFTSAARPSLARLGHVAAARLSGRAEVRVSDVPVHVAVWIQDHTPRMAVCVGGDHASPSILEGLTWSFALFMAEGRQH